MGGQRVAQALEQREAWRLAELWRDSGRNVVLGAGGSFKSQMKKADASRARYALVIGDDEAARGVVGVKDLRHDAPQVELPHAAVAAALAAALDARRP